MLHLVQTQTKTKINRSKLKFSCFFLQIFVTIRKFVRLTAPHPWSSPTPPTSASAGTRCPMLLVCYGPTLPVLPAWPQLAIAMETKQLSDLCDYLCALEFFWVWTVFINRKKHSCYLACSPVPFDNDTFAPYPIMCPPCTPPHTQEQIMKKSKMWVIRCSTLEGFNFKAAV